ncbi:membrane or secreted protein [Christiangramia forsetii KT0803]|uniref:Membrane or secreted protein n=3 Tax=Christiangramia forsetii TaxID=411153 RepID=A0LY96_CHRFK|nr:hypothetical protein GCM10011532_18060 [Christiangramia forsetii]CAL65341.1 membrane or secreted protein [Christiangramia forsetii KT0803]
MAFFSLTPKIFKMKKALILIMAAIFSLSIYSCRETTQEKTEEAAKAIGEDIEAGAEEAGEKIKKGAKKVGEEIDEEIHETDDVNGEEATDDAA